MPLPLVPIAAGVGLAALLFAGSKEKTAATPASPGVSATPTQSSTNGPEGGATVPSHSDVGAQGGEVNTNVGGRGETNEGYLTAPTAPASYGSSGDSIAAPMGEPIFVGSKSEPIATGVAGVGGAALGGQFGQLAGSTTRYVGKAFETWGDAFGAIW